MEEKHGYIYILTNKSFEGHNWVKIGYSVDVERRTKELSGTSLPYPYEIYAKYEVPKLSNGSDKALHSLIQKLNPSLRLTSNREFFEITPEDAYEILKSMATIHGREDKLEKKPGKKNTNQVVQKSQKEDKEIDSSSREEKNGEAIETRFYIKNVKKIIIAGCVYDGKKYTVLKGSKVVEKEWPSFPSSCKKLYDELVRNETIANNEFQADFIFESASGAACVILKRSVNGRAIWKDKNGVSLGKYL